MNFKHRGATRRTECICKECLMDRSYRSTKSSLKHPHTQLGGLWNIIKRGNNHKGFKTTLNYFPLPYWLWKSRLEEKSVKSLGDNKVFKLFLQGSSPRRQQKKSDKKSEGKKKPCRFNYTSNSGTVDCLVDLHEIFIGDKKVADPRRLHTSFTINQISKKRADLHEIFIESLMGSLELFRTTWHLSFPVQTVEELKRKFS